MRRILCLLNVIILLAASNAYTTCTYDAGKLVRCLSSDSKPAVVDGYVLIETDTGKLWRRDSGSWSEITDHDVLSNTGTNSHAQIDSNLIYLRHMLSTGLLWGGLLSQATTTQFNLSAGGGLFIDSYTDPQNPTLSYVTWAEQTDIADLYITTADETQIHIDISGNIVQVDDDVYIDDPDRKDYIHIGGIGHPDRAEISYILNEPVFLSDVFLQLYDFLYSFGAFNITGNEYSANGATLEVNRSAGKVFDVGANKENSVKSPNIIPSDTAVATPMYYGYTDGGGAWLYSEATTTIDPEQYDTMTGLAAVPAGKWTVQTITYYSNGDFTDVQYGQAYYDSLAAAESAINNGYTLDPFLAYDVFRCWLVVKQGATALNNIAQAKFINKIGFSGTGVGTGGGGGEVNTASNIGAAGVGLFHGKSGVDLQFKNIEAASSKVLVTDYTTSDTVRIDVDTASLVLSQMSGSVTLAQLPDDDATSGRCLLSGGAGGDPAYSACPGGGGGDSVTINTVAVVDADFDDTTPTAPGDGINVRWQKDASSPANVSANVPYGTTSATVATGDRGVTSGNSHDHNGGDGAQIAYSSLSSLPVLPSNEAGATNNFLTAYNSTTGAFSKAQPSFTNISGTASDAQLANNYSGTGTCTNQFPRTLNDNAAPTCASIATADLPVIDISKGGTTETASTEDAVLVGAGTTDWAPKVLPSCSNATTSKLLYDNSANSFSCGTDQTGGGGSPVGIFSDIQFSILQSDGTLNAASGVQTWAGTNKTAQDVFTVDANATYHFKGQWIVNTGATTHTTAMAFALTTATVTSFEYLATLWSAALNTISTTQSTVHVTGVASKAINSTSTSVYTLIQFEGEFVTGTGGTITPQINFSANPTGTNLMKRGSYIMIQKLGADTIVETGGWQ